jgi:hypothetical protein
MATPKAWLSSFNRFEGVKVKLGGGELWSNLNFGFFVQNPQDIKTVTFLLLISFILGGKIARSTVYSHTYLKLKDTLSLFG